jgi:transcriptional regulator with XRE-family HTH domain
VARPRPNRVRERRAIFGDAVRERRIAEGLTQEALAERAGIDRKSISRIENGAFSPSLDRIWLIADALRVSVTDLIGATGTVEPPER